jgi:hypothetical protein
MSHKGCDPMQNPLMGPVLSNVPVRSIDREELRPETRSRRPLQARHVPQRVDREALP